MPVISITADKILKIPIFLGFFSSMMIFMIFSIIMMIIYITSIKKVTDSDGKEYYKYPSSGLLISGLCFSLISLISSFVCFGYYYSMFQFQKSYPFVMILSVLGVDCGLTGVILYFILKVKSYCPNQDDVFSKQFGRCVPDCEKGSLLDEKSFVCIEGCRQDSDCPDGQPCILHQCCDLNTHTLTDKQSFCCTKEDVFCLSGSHVDTCPQEDLVCCSSKVICKNDKGEPICCADPDAVCKDTGKGGQFCAISCGNDVCNEDEICTITDIFGNTTYKCEKIDSTGCTRVGDRPYYFPDAINNFYPAYKPIDSSKLNDVLQCNPYDDSQKCTDQLKQAFHTDDLSSGNKYGYICGVPEHDGMNFESHSFTGGDKCTTQYLLQNIAIPGETDKAYIKYADDGNVLFNIRNVITNKGNKLDQYSPASSFMVKTSNQRKNGVVGSEHQVQYFKGKIPSLSQLNDDLCTSTNSYQDSCDPDFQQCSDKQECPFGNESDIYDCVYDDRPTGVINKKREVLRRVCVIEQSEVDDDGGVNLRVTGYKPCDCYTPDCSECGLHTDVNVEDVDGDCNNLYVDPNSEIGKQYLQFSPRNDCKYSGNWSECDAEKSMKDGIQIYEYHNKSGSKKSSAMEPVVFYGDFYSPARFECSHDNWKQNVLVRMCDKKNFQEKTIDTQFDDAGQIVRPKNMCGISAGYDANSWQFCSPNKILWTIDNAGEETSGKCNSSSSTWDTGCGSRCACQDKLSAVSNAFYSTNTHWKFSK